MQAVILAAGMGKRLKELTRDNTKCMVQVNGVTLISRLLHQLEGRQLSRVIIVVGYQGQKLMDYIGTLDLQIPVVFVENPIYDKTNNIYSLALAKDWLCREDTLLFESDLIFEDEVIDLLVNDQRDTLALVDRYESWMDGTCVKLAEDDSITEFVPGKKFRFEERDGMLGAVIHPKHRILPLLRGHFCSRLPDESFLIYDAAHGTALLHRDGQVRYLTMERYIPGTDETELDWQRMWKRFFKALTIEQRRDEKAQMNHVPKRFWQDMCEMQADLL